MVNGLRPVKSKKLVLKTTYRGQGFAEPNPHSIGERFRYLGRLIKNEIRVKKSILLAAYIFQICHQPASAQSSWHMQTIPIQTRWAKEVSPENALPEYPRPQMTRPNWTNLNGLWDYVITVKDAPAPVKYDGKILVPYPLESSLSGIKKPLQPSQNLWYHRSFVRPDLKAGERLLLHFGAVDWQTMVFVNGHEVGDHTGGYTAFTIDITSGLKKGENEILVKVFDPTDQGIGPHGKQVLNPHDIYYTPTSGIWQTVWLETVPAAYIQDILLTPDIDKQELAATVVAPVGYTVELTASSGASPVATAEGNSQGTLVLSIKSTHLWFPADPFLYDLTVRLKKGGKVVDEVKSYFGMRKISIGKDEKGIDRICLNNKPYYNLGVLDQGFWPDGIYTAPTDEALAFDIKAIKAMGFNTIRKHIKVEPARWYYHADKLGMLVWQDMVNPNQSLPEGAKAEFEKESAEILHQLHNAPSIVTWVLFNEKWGQFDQERLTKWIKATDPSRIVNGHTGEILYVNEVLRSPSPNAYVAADITDVHSYPDPMMPVKQAGKAQVLGEFGGIGVFIPDHQWNSASAWGYITEKPAALAVKYGIMNQHLQLLQRDGLSGSIYTQPFDVEGEQNGLMTYDRAIAKIPFDQIRRIHSPLNSETGTLPEVAIQNADLTDPGQTYSQLLPQYLDGNRQPAFLKRLMILASQVGDKPGARQFGAEYFTSLVPPLSEEDIRVVAQFTQSTADPGFKFITANAEAFQKVLGDRPYTVALMNMIYKGEIEPDVTGQLHPNWTSIGNRIKPYGAPGDEIFQRAKTIYYLNNQDWENYIPAAKAYIAQYGSNLRDSERKRFESMLQEHSEAAAN